MKLVHSIRARDQIPREGWGLALLQSGECRSGSQLTQQAAEAAPSPVRGKLSLVLCGLR